MDNKNIKSFIVALMIILNNGILKAQVVDFPYIKNQMAVSFSYSRNGFIPYKIMENDGLTAVLRGANMEVLYGLNNWFELGVVVDVSYVKEFKKESGLNCPTFLLPTIQCYCGEISRVHLLTMFWPEFSFMDVYFSGMLGACGTFSTKKWPQPRHVFIAQGGAGVGINPSRHFGFFFEYGLNNRRNKYTLLGLNIRFGGPKKWRNTRQ